jgi:histidinol-phosphatase (PHP family)
MASIQPKTWITKDFHVHESHSSDAPGATVEKYCKVAEIRGIDEVAFTTHLIISGPDVEHGLSPHTISEYLDEIATAQETTSVKLRAGLEVDYFPEKERYTERILEEHPLDYVLGSLHYIRGIDIGSRRQSPRFFSGRPIQESLDIYYEDWRKGVESGLFDVMAHPDYFRKYLPLTHPQPITWEEYGTTVYDAIDSLKSYGVGVEVNASGWRHGIKDVYPIRGFMEAVREAGIDKVAVGSDCHRVHDLGVNTVKAVRRLEEVGYSHLCVFEGRRNRKISLADLRT